MTRSVCRMRSRRRSSLLPAVAVVVLGALPGAALAGPSGSRGVVLSTHALAGPAASETRIAWLEQRQRCAGAAVRDAATLRRHDIGTPVCTAEGEASLFFKLGR